MARRKKGKAVHGWLVLDKPAGMTSTQAVGAVRRLYDARKAGHAGTLDPLATGVLPILFESSTRLAEFALQLTKTYVADIHFGFTTQTDDAEGERVAGGDASHLTAEAVVAALDGFRGRILQTPPAFSAVKVDGKRAYAMARRGEEPRPEPREVVVHEVNVLGFEPGAEPVARVEIRCGSGTYLRAIARDLGERLGVGGYLGRLVRTAYGPLELRDAARLEDLPDADAVRARLLPAEVILPVMERVRLSVEQEAMVRQGRPVRVLPEPAPGAVRAHDMEGRLVALGHTDPLRRTFVPTKVLS